MGRRQLALERKGERGKKKEDEEERKGKKEQGFRVYTPRISR